jgi:digeranylgeranylglycerophospholipid reductase
MKNYDVAVVGSGPVGSTFARYVAEDGYDVVILEKKRKIGVPLQCAGLLGKKIKKVNILPEDYIINSVCGAYIHSPGNTVLKVAKKEPEAYVLDRVGYDKFLADLAVDSGAQILLNHRVQAVDTVKGELFLKTSASAKLSADVVVGADGHSSIVSSAFNRPAEFFQAVQYLVDVGENRFQENHVHLYVDSRVSPGFLWIIPLSSSTARVGLFADCNYQQQNIILEELLLNNVLRGSTIKKKYFGLIPKQEPPKKLVKDRAMLLGDAASQIKPTTGGGLIMGFTCAEIASKVVSKALQSEDIDILQDYPKKYHNKFKNEIRIQIKLQKIFQSLNNSDLEYMFQKLKEEGAEDIISQYGDMDSQSTLIKELIKRRIFYSILPKIFSRRITNLWK